MEFKNMWFTSDWHFGHANIIKYCDRPWTNTDKMDRDLVKKFNECVEPEDTVFVLGDISMKTRQHRGYYQQIISKLNGHKHLIMGNHDYLKPQTYLELGFLSFHSSLVVPVPGLGAVYLTHDPAISVVDKDNYWLCGHVHDLFKTLMPKRKVINVGVDVWDYKPVHMDAIRVLFKGAEDEQKS